MVAHKNTIVPRKLCIDVDILYNSFHQYVFLQMPAETSKKRERERDIERERREKR